MCVFVFKKKTAYEMRISDWSSDVCSSDLSREIDGRVSNVYIRYMSKTSVITARINADTLDLVDRIAAAQGRSRSWFAAEAVRRMAEEEAAFLAFVQAGIDSADRGELIPQEAVFERLRARRMKRHAA